MKKLISILLILAVMVLGIVAVSADDGEVITVGAEEEREILYLADFEDPVPNPNPGLWFASAVQDGGQWVTTVFEDGYCAVSFFANKPFSTIGMPFWAGASTFPGIEPGTMQLAIFKTDASKATALDYNIEDALIKEEITTDHDIPDFEWTFDQLPGGSYTFRVMFPTEANAYLVLSQGEPLEGEFDIDYVSAPGEGFHCYVVLDEGEEVTPEPTPEPTATPEPTDTPEPTAEPTDAPETGDTEATEAPATEAPADSSKTEEKKGCGSIISISGLSVVALAAAAFVLKKRS
ncbi:MAG: hypothetical protein IJS71_02530 [Clostridia bacterium]|nr:hypothetical protein [Clostridia bacterium]